jgi:hypothetical protein
VRGSVCAKGHDQSDQQDPVTIEVSADDQRAGRQHGDRDQNGEADAQRAHPGDDRLAALADGAPMGKRPGQFLLQRQEEARCQSERGDPQAGDRLHRVVAAQGDLGDLEEEVAGDPGNQ